MEQQRRLQLDHRKLHGEIIPFNLVSIFSRIGKTYKRLLINLLALLAHSWYPQEVAFLPCVT
jgi:hypothetical protein